MELVKAQHEKAKKILTENRRKLDELAAFLYEKETITGDEFMEILGRKEVPGEAASGSAKHAGSQSQETSMDAQPASVRKGKEGVQI